MLRKVLDNYKMRFGEEPEQYKSTKKESDHPEIDE
jgi:hypothetical protein